LLLVIPMLPVATLGAAYAGRDRAFRALRVHGILGKVRVREGGR
jgi:hypothetical protein